MSPHASPAPDLWPDFSLHPSTNAPAKVLREQAQIFNRRLGGLLIAEVKILVQNHQGVQTSDFLVKAPLLNDYALTLFTCEHAIAAPYPVRIHGAQGLWSADAAQREAADEAALLKTLGEIFASPFMRQTVDGLITTSKGIG